MLPAAAAFSAVCLGAPSSSRGPWGAPLALTYALCICLLAVVWCYQQQLSSLLLLVATSSSCSSAVVWVPPTTARGALGCSPWLEALGCSPGPDMCSLHMFSAVAWCYQQQLSLCCCWLLPAAVVPLLLSGYHQQQQWASGCSPWPCFFFPPISSLRFPPCCPNGGGESPFYRYNYRQCL